MNIKKMTDLALAGQRVLIRVDLNVPVDNGQVTSDARIKAILPTVQHAVKAGAKVILMSHLGRPKEGQFDEAASLAPVAKVLSQLLKQPVRLERDWINGVNVNAGEVVLGENVRFLVGENADDETLARKMAALCDIFVMDAFATAHRAQASTHGVARFAPIACAGPLLVAELDALAKVMLKPARPLLAIVGGSKVSTKLEVLDALSKIADQIIVGGGIANTFIAAQGHTIGKSLSEPDLLPEAKRLLQKITIPVPTDVVVAKEFSKTATAQIKAVTDIADDDMILDIGPQTAQTLAKQIQQAKTILWNGPVGVFEFSQFSEGTRVIAEAIANSAAFSVAGGGDTLAAIDQFGIADKMGYISTGGGAFLEFIEGKKLPAVAILEERA